MEQFSNEKPINFVETLTEKTPKVFIKGSEDTEIYFRVKMPMIIVILNLKKLRRQIRNLKIEFVTHVKKNMFL